VGYGDIHPATPVGKLLAVVIIITGVGTFLGVVANVTELFLEKREREATLEKLNMVIGVFFSELGSRLLALFARTDPDVAELRRRLAVLSDWSDADVKAVRAFVRTHNFGVDRKRLCLEEIAALLEEKGDVLLRVWENPNVLEHDEFTSAIRAVFHLREELTSRRGLSDLPDTDRAHLAGDIKRAYAATTVQWLDYMTRLKRHYPYLFSHAMRTNPFDEDASPVVT
jgi:hypothetical protein